MPVPFCPCFSAQTGACLGSFCPNVTPHPFGKWKGREKAQKGISVLAPFALFRGNFLFWISRPLIHFLISPSCLCLSLDEYYS